MIMIIRINDNENDNDDEYDDDDDDEADRYSAGSQPCYRPSEHTQAATALTRR